MNIKQNLYKKRAKKALKALFVADSIAMPVHWYYRVSDIYKEFPEGIHQLEDAPKFHPSSIMSLHSKQQGGRKHLYSKNNKNIIGDLILKGKGKHWGQANVHYHQGMKAGENTLNAHCVRVLLQSMIDTNGRYDKNHYLENYIAMMTTENPQQNDTYAESYHRGFFANLAEGKEIKNCGAVTHDTASIGGLVSIGPLAIMLFLSGHDLMSVKNQCADHLVATHPDKFLTQVCNNHVELIQSLLFRDEQQSSFGTLLMVLNKSIKLNFKTKDFSTIVDSSIVGGKFSTACYITDSWPSVLFLAAKYEKDLNAGILANANLGGDNVHRGSVLGFLLGLIDDTENPQLNKWYSSLVNSEAIDSEINDLLNFID
jgi:ADP-ribosylglycohydrolase